MSQPPNRRSATVPACRNAEGEEEGGKEDSVSRYVLLLDDAKARQERLHKEIWQLQEVLHEMDLVAVVGGVARDGPGLHEKHLLARQARGGRAEASAQFEDEEDQGGECGGMSEGGCERGCEQGQEVESVQRRLAVAMLTRCFQEV
jgi:hypothetical protein